MVPRYSALTMQRDPRVRAATLSCWSGPVDVKRIAGGITNSNFRVEHGGRRHFVRIGADIPRHGIMRFHELAASRAARPGQNLDERSEENREEALALNRGKRSPEHRGATRETRESDRHLGVCQQNRMDAHF